MSTITSFPRLEVSAARDLQSRPSGVCLPPSSAAESAAAVRTAAEPTAAARTGAESTAVGARSPVRGALFASVTRCVWAAPAAKLLGFCSVLACVAWLGERSRDTTIYGPELPKDVSSPSPAVAVPAAPAGDSSGASAPPSAPLPPSAALAAPCASGSVSAQPSRAASAILPDGRLVLNEASAEELDRLPGIGKKRAEDIVLLRQRLGRFKRATDLLRVRGIGPRSLASLKDHLVLDRPAPPPEGADTGAPHAAPLAPSDAGPGTRGASPGTGAGPE